MRWYFFIVAGAALLLITLVGVNRSWPSEWTSAERDQLLSLWLQSLPPLPPDPSNHAADDPKAARLGARIFRDPRFSKNGDIACASCHQPQRAFTDGRRVAQGTAVGRRNTPSVVGSAYGAWFFWDGRRDSQWAQALAPLENHAECDGRRTHFAHIVAQHYAAEYEAVFGALPALDRERFPPQASPSGSPADDASWRGMTSRDRGSVNRIFANIGKSLAAYQRQLTLKPSRFDRYVEQLASGNHWFASLLLSETETAGLRLFIGRANCTSCHRGPLFTSFEFFSIGLPVSLQAPDAGRAHVFTEVLEDPFNCRGRYSDASDAECTELRFLAHDPLAFFANFKTPSLRNVAKTAPYMHDGRFQHLQDVVAHYDRAARVPFPEHSDIVPLGLSEGEQNALIAFLRTLTSETRDPLGEALGGSAVPRVPDDQNRSNR